MKISKVKGKGQVKVPDYRTWYDFKKDLEKETGHTLLNAAWLYVKPAAPLPWSESYFRSSIRKIERAGRHKPHSRCLIHAN